MDEDLHPVAYAQDGQGPFVDPGWRQGSAGIVDAGGASRQDDSPGVDPRHLVPRGVSRYDLAVDLQLPDPAGDKPAILGAEVYDDYALADILGLGLLLDSILLTSGDLQVG